MFPIFIASKITKCFVLIKMLIVMEISYCYAKQIKQIAPYAKFNPRFNIIFSPDFTLLTIDLI